MNWRPGVDVGTARARAGMLGRTRDYFLAQGVLEVSTPALGRTTATDPNIASICVKFGGGSAFLHTSPEYCMKRLLAAGYPDIYQVCRVFRDGEAGRLHLPEFTMIEWYRLGFGLEAIMADTIALIARLFAHRKLAAASFVSYSAAFREALAIDPLDTNATVLADALDADGDLRRSLGDDTDSWLDLAMATRVANSFATDRLTAVFHYPASQAALARSCPDDARVADRFEIYLGQIELANGFVELTDADEQLRRFEADQRKRAAAGMPVPEIDNDLVDALRTGLPDCAGVALGLDRMLMIDEGHDDIRKVTPFTSGTDDGN